MIEVEVGEHDVPQVARVEPGRSSCRIAVISWAEVGQREEEPAQPLARVVHVVRAEAGVDQHQPVGPFDQQAVARERPRTPRENPSISAPPAGHVEMQLRW